MPRHHWKILPALIFLCAGKSFAANECGALDLGLTRDMDSLVACLQQTREEVQLLFTENQRLEREIDLMSRLAEVNNRGANRRISLSNKIACMARVESSRTRQDLKLDAIYANQPTSCDEINLFHE